MTPSASPAVATGSAGSAAPVSTPEWARLSADEIDSYVTRCGTASDHVSDTSKVLGFFQTDSRPTFYRRDLSTILKKVGHDAKTIGYGKSGDQTLAAIHALAVKASARSWWILNAAAPALPDVDKAASERSDVVPAPVEVGTHPTTIQWFEQQIRDNALDRKCAHLLRRKRPDERFEDMLSHVGYWFAKWGSMGQCDKFIAAGKPPTVSILTCWLEHKFSHDEYRRAKDALHREAGKRTQSEIRHRRFLGVDDYISPGADRSDPNAPDVAWKAGTEEGDDSLEREFVSPESEPLTDIFDEEELSLARDVVRVCRNRAADRYARFLDHLFDGRSKEEAAELEGCSELRVTHMYQRVRDDLRGAPVLIEVAMKVLALISEEPWSTQEEIEEEIPKDDSLERALKLLAIRGLLTEGSGQAFAPTDAGRNAVHMGSLI